MREAATPPASAYHNRRLARRKVWFGVGSASGRQSPVYSVFFSTRKGDVYVSGRAIAHDVKASLHESGRYRIARVAKPNADELTPDAADRAFVKWNRPSPFEPGLTRALQIVVPPSVVTDLNARLDEPEKVVWVPPAPDSFATYFDVIFSVAGWRGTKWNGGEWPGKDAVDSTLIYSHPLCNGESLWVVACVLDFDEAGWIKHHGIEPEPLNIRTMYFATHKRGGHGVYVEAPLSAGTLPPLPEPPVN